MTRKTLPATTATATPAAHRIVVLGAGYTGMTAAIRVAHRTRRLGAQVQLVNPSARLAERLRMHQSAAGQELADFRIPELIKGTDIEFVQGWARSLNLEAQEVLVDTDEGPRILPFDTLVFALGSATDTTVVPGIDEHAFTLNGHAAAGALAARLAVLDAWSTQAADDAAAAHAPAVTVCGSGLTGVEAAAEIAEAHPGLRVTLLGRAEPGSMMGPKARAYLHRALDRLGVEVRHGLDITKVLPDGVELASGELVPSDATVWTAGVRVPALAAASGLATDDAGRVVTDETLRSTSHPAVWAVGDAAAVRQPFGLIHGTCQSGIPTAVHAADQIARTLRGRAPRRFRFGYIHQPVSLGRHDAVIQFTRPDDTPRRAHLTGKRAIAYKEFVSSTPPKTFRLSTRFNIPSHMLWFRGGRKTK